MRGGGRTGCSPCHSLRGSAPDHTADIKPCEKKTSAAEASVISCGAGCHSFRNSCSVKRVLGFCCEKVLPRLLKHLWYCTVVMWKRIPTFFRCLCIKLYCVLCCVQALAMFHIMSIIGVVFWLNMKSNNSSNSIIKFFILFTEKKKWEVARRRFPLWSNDIIITVILTVVIMMNLWTCERNLYNKPPHFTEKINPTDDSTVNCITPHTIIVSKCLPHTRMHRTGMLLSHKSGCS